MTNPERFDEREFWCKEGEEFWRQIVPPEEDRTLFTTALWRGEFRWFRSPNVVPLEQGLLCSPFASVVNVPTALGRTARRGLSWRMEADATLAHREDAAAITMAFSKFSCCEATHADEARPTAAT